MDLDYLLRRLDEERRRAAEADCPAARKAHGQLAEHYAAQIERLQAEAAEKAAPMPKLTIVPPQHD